MTLNAILYVWNMDTESHSATSVERTSHFYLKRNGIRVVRPAHIKLYDMATMSMCMCAEEGNTIASEEEKSNRFVSR